MEDIPVHIIRESTRNLLKLNRRIQKDEESDSRRSIQKQRITAETVTDISNKLKTKSCISLSDIQTLKNGLINDCNNIELVLQVHGALRGLIRELTGHDGRKQCAAAGCCCNLALGDSRGCMIIAKAAGSYLTTALDNLSTEFAVTCAWTLGNLAGSDSKVCDILVSQGALAKLSEPHTNEDLQEAALYALVHFSSQMRDELRPEALSKLLQTIAKLEIGVTSAELLFILSCHDSFSEIVDEELLQKILEDLPKTIESNTQTCSRKDICWKLVYLIRTLANLDRFYEVILNYFIVNNMSDVFKYLLNSNNTLSDSCLWLLGNLYNFCDNKHFFSTLIC